MGITVEEAKKAIASKVKVTLHRYEETQSLRWLECVCAEWVGKSVPITGLASAETDAIIDIGETGMWPLSAITITEPIVEVPLKVLEEWKNVCE